MRSGALALGLRSYSSGWPPYTASGHCVSSVHR